MVQATDNALRRTWHVILEEGVSLVFHFSMYNIIIGELFL